MVLLAIVAAAGIFFNTLLLNVAAAVLSVLAVLELFKATGLTLERGLLVDISPTSGGACNTGPMRERWLLDLALAGAVIIPFVTVFGAAMPLMLFALALGYFALLVKNYGKVSLGNFATAMLLGTLVPLSFTCAVLIRDSHSVEAGGFYLLIALGTAWVSDIGAYFAGTFFGKRKLAPKVSPKKTIEGTIGGIVVSAGLILLLGMPFELLLGMFGRPVIINFVPLGIFLPLFSIIGMLGDLSASAVKREYGIKDFGAVMPGHGGVMDRFDSVLFTLPAVYLATRHIELITML